MRYRLILLSSCLGLVALSAFGATNASAVTLHECKEAVGTGEKFSDSACSTKSETGKFQTVPVPVGTATGLTFTSTSSTTFSTTVAGVQFKIVCAGGSGSGTAINEKVGETMKVRGEKGISKFEGCSVTVPAGKGCTVPSTLETNTLKSETSEMKDVITPASGTTFMTITVSGCTVAALNGSKTVQGCASGINNNGTTTEFTSTSGSALTYGGQSATLLGSTHSKVTATGVRVGLLTP